MVTCTTAEGVPVLTKFRSVDPRPVSRAATPKQA